MSDSALNIEDTPGVVCHRCGRQGVVSRPWVLGDPLDISVMVIGQNPGFPDEGMPNPHKAFYGHSFTCSTIMDVVRGARGVYLTNVVKCAHKKEITRGQITKCSDLFLQYEIAFCDPDLIVCLGNVAEQAVSRILPESHRDKIQKMSHPGYIKRMGWSEQQIAEYMDALYGLIRSGLRCKYE